VLGLLSFMYEWAGAPDGAGGFEGGRFTLDYKIDELMCQARRKAAGRIQNVLTR
jgi:hypothetical protein